MARYLKVGDRVLIQENRPGFDITYNGATGTVQEECPDYPNENLHVAVDFSNKIYCSEDETFSFIEGPSDDEFRNEEMKWRKYFE